MNYLMRKHICTFLFSKSLTQDNLSYLKYEILPYKNNCFPIKLIKPKPFYIFTKELLPLCINKTYLVSILRHTCLFLQRQMLRIKSSYITVFSKSQNLILHLRLCIASYLTQDDFMIQNKKEPHEPPNAASLMHLVMVQTQD